MPLRCPFPRMGERSQLPSSLFLIFFPLHDGNMNDFLPLLLFLPAPSNQVMATQGPCAISPLLGPFHLLYDKHFNGRAIFFPLSRERPFVGEKRDSENRGVRISPQNSRRKRRPFPWGLSFSVLKRRRAEMVTLSRSPGEKRHDGDLPFIPLTLVGMEEKGSMFFSRGILFAQ